MPKSAKTASFLITISITRFRGNASFNVSRRSRYKESSLYFRFCGSRSSNCQFPDVSQASRFTTNKKCEAVKFYFEYVLSKFVFFRDTEPKLKLITDQMMNKVKILA